MLNEVYKRSLPHYALHDVKADLGESVKRSPNLLIASRTGGIR